MFAKIIARTCQRTACRSFTTDLSKLKYTTQHEWINTMDSKSATVGISDFAQAALGDVVFCDLPEVGRVLKKGESFGSVESVKAASDVYAPMSGKVVAINEKVKAEPSVINQSPFDKAWLIKIALSDPAEASSLLNAAAYKKLCDESHH